MKDEKDNIDQICTNFITQPKCFYFVIRNVTKIKKRNGIG